eukprot:285965-Pelagomonas_calceolata.AAC.1
MVQETGISRRLLENFAEVASSHRFAPIKKPLPGSFEADVPLITDTEKIHVMAVQVRGELKGPNSVHDWQLGDARV